MTDLLKDLEAGPPSRELSDRVLLACGWRETEHGGWYPPGGSIARQNRPDPTRNLQDAVDWVVPEGWRWGRDQTGFVFVIQETWPETQDGPITFGCGNEATPVTNALCIAALRAREER